jgi:hypothetical protein
MKIPKQPQNGPGLRFGKRTSDMVAVILPRDIQNYSGDFGKMGKMN